MMKDESIANAFDDADVSKAVAIITERELDGQDALQKFVMDVTNRVQWQTQEEMDYE